MVGEGSTRDFEKASFNQSNVDCISCVAGISSSDSGSGPLDGQLYRPLKTPRIPIGAGLWVRLRTALFGSAPTALIAEMSRIPRISEEEAKTLVEHGIDSLPFFAAGLIDLPSDLTIEKSRLEHLQSQARYLIWINETRQMRNLRSAQGLDLSPSHEEGIFTIDQLLQKNRPLGVDEALWCNLRREAATLTRHIDLQ